MVVETGDKNPKDNSVFRPLSFYTFFFLFSFLISLLIWESLNLKHLSFPVNKFPVKGNLNPKNAIAITIIRLFFSIVFLHRL